MTRDDLIAVIERIRDTATGAPSNSDALREVKSIANESLVNARYFSDEGKDDGR